MNFHWFSNILISCLLLDSASASVSTRPIQFGCIKEFSGEVSYNETQLTGSLLVRFRSNYHCTIHCGYHDRWFGDTSKTKDAILGKFDLSKLKGCGIERSQYIAAKAMIQTGGNVKSFSTPVDEIDEASTWVAINNSLKYNETHWKIVLNKQIEVIHVPLMATDDHNKPLYIRFDFQDPDLRNYLNKQWDVEAFAKDERDCKKLNYYMFGNRREVKETLLFNPNYSLVVNHQCLIAIHMLEIMNVPDRPRRERCLTLEKNSWQLRSGNLSWQDTKPCTHERIQTLRYGLFQNDNVHDIKHCKTLPFRKGDKYISCEDGQNLQTVVVPTEGDVAAKILLNFAKFGISQVPFVGNILVGIIGYLEKPDSLKSVAVGVSQSLNISIEKLGSKPQIISKIAETMSNLIP